MTSKTVREAAKEYVVTAYPQYFPITTNFVPKEIKNEISPYYGINPSNETLINALNSAFYKLKKQKEKK